MLKMQMDYARLAFQFVGCEFVFGPRHFECSQIEFNRLRGQQHGIKSLSLLIRALQPALKVITVADNASVIIWLIGTQCLVSEATIKCLEAWYRSVGDVDPSLAVVPLFEEAGWTQGEKNSALTTLHVLARRRFGSFRVQKTICSSWDVRMTFSLQHVLS